MTERILEQLARDLDRLRLSNSLTQKALYEATSPRVSEGTISRILRARDCRISTLSRVGDALGVEVRVVFRRKTASN